MKLYIDDHDISEFGLQVLEGYEYPLLGAISAKRTNIPGLRGFWDFGDEIGEIEDTFPVTLIEVNPIERQKILREFMRLILDGEGKPKFVKVRNSYEPDKFSFCKVSLAPTPSYFNSGADFQLQLISPDGVRYATSSQYNPKVPLEYDKGHQYGIMGYPNTESFDWIYTRHYSGLQNYSSLNADIKITITGTVKDGKVTHLETGQSMLLPDITNGTIVIDSNNYTLSVNGMDSIFDGEFFNLVSGDNGFLFEAEEVSAKVKYEWYHRFN